MTTRYMETGALCTHSLDPESGAPGLEPAPFAVSGSPVCVALGSTGPRAAQLLRRRSRMNPRTSPPVIIA